MCSIPGYIQVPEKTRADDCKASKLQVQPQLYIQLRYHGQHGQIYEVQYQFNSNTTNRPPIFSTGLFLAWHSSQIHCPFTPSHNDNAERDCCRVT